MSRRQFSKGQLAIVAGLGLAFGVFALVYVTRLAHRNPPTVQSNYRTTSSLPSTNKSVVGQPLRLKIPKIAIDSAIEPMGLTLAGDMDAPQNVANAGWYKLGVRPGEVGSAVIAGHLDGVHAEPGVFINLNKLTTGDAIQVVDDVGKSISFSVREVRLYNQTDRPSEVFNSTTGRHLNLITCTGAWDTKAGKFSQRLVVFADSI